MARNPVLKIRIYLVASRSIAKHFRVGEEQVKKAKSILTDAPDLADQVLNCTLSIAAAYEKLQSRKAESRQKAKDAEKVAEYTDAISAGD